MTEAQKNNKNDTEAGKSKEAEEHPTSYIETIIHLFKGNIGPGLFAMGDAFKNGGILVSPILTVIIAIICVHCQHLLLVCAGKVKVLRSENELPDYAETVEKCFEVGPPKLRSWAPIIRTIVNIFICVTQLGFCCIYFVFISTNFNQILKFYGVDISVHLVMAICFIPVLLTSLITNLKYLTPVSMIANFCMIFGLVTTIAIAVWNGVPSPTERNYYTSPNQLALYFGTSMFAFEGIALVLPLKNAMKKPKNFDRSAGVLNVGMVLVTVAFLMAGIVGYLKWGEEVAGSLTLNLETGYWLSQVVKIAVSIGVLFGYPLQFFVAIKIMLSSILPYFKNEKYHYYVELAFRTFMVIITLFIAQLVPQLGLFISLIGAVCSTALALVFPPLIELIIKSDGTSKGPGCFVFVKNFCILILALLGFVTGTWQSLYEIIKEFSL